MKAILLLALVAFVAAADPCEDLKIDDCLAQSGCGWEKAACVSCAEQSTEKACLAVYGCGYWYEKPDADKKNCQSCRNLEPAVPYGKCHRYNGCTIAAQSCTDDNIESDEPCLTLSEGECAFVAGCEWTGLKCLKVGDAVCTDYNKAKCVEPQCKKGTNDDECLNPDAPAACSTLTALNDCVARTDCFWKGKNTDAKKCSPLTELETYCTGEKEACIILDYTENALVGETQCKFCEAHHSTAGCQKDACILDCTKGTTETCGKTDFSTCKLCTESETNPNTCQSSCSFNCEKSTTEATCKEGEFATKCSWCETLNKCQTTGSDCDCAYLTYDECNGKTYQSPKTEGTGYDTKKCFYCTTTGQCLTEGNKASCATHAECQDRLPDACVSTLLTVDTKECVKCEVNNYCAKKTEDTCYTSCLNHAAGVEKSVCETATDKAAAKHCDYCPFSKTCGYIGECETNCDAAGVDKDTCGTDTTKCQWCKFTDDSGYCDKKEDTITCAASCKALNTKEKCSEPKVSTECKWCELNEYCGVASEECEVACAKLVDEPTCTANAKPKCKWDGKKCTGGATRIALSFVAVVVAFAVALF